MARGINTANTTTTTITTTGKYLLHRRLLPVFTDYLNSRYYLSAFAPPAYSNI
jgi:hypothetical protein